MLNDVTSNGIFSRKDFSAYLEMTVRWEESSLISTITIIRGCLASEKRTKVTFPGYRQGWYVSSDDLVVRGTIVRPVEM